MHRLATFYLNLGQLWLTLLRDRYNVDEPISAAVIGNILCAVGGATTATHLTDGTWAVSDLSVRERLSGRTRRFGWRLS
jgi:hypothetical protein